MDSVPDSAACNEAVKLAQKKGFYSLKGFVNGVMRNVARKKEEITYPDAKTRDPAEYLSVYYSVPQWLVERWVTGLWNRDDGRYAEGFSDGSSADDPLPAAPGRSGADDQQSGETRERRLSGRRIFRMRTICRITATSKDLNLL